MAEPKTIMNGGPDRSVTDSPERIFEALFRVHDMRFEVCLPAIVRDYNRNSHLALVQPLVNMVSSEGEQLERSTILVPVRRVMYGEFMVDFPLNIGDTGWVIAGDRDSENALLANSGDVTSSSNPNKGGQRPATRLLHKYRFGFFIPDRWGNIDLGEEYGAGEDDAVICSRNGKTKIVLTKDGNATIDLNGSLGISSSQVVIGGNVSIGGNLSIDGDIDTTGGVTAAGSVHSSEDISSDGYITSNSDIMVNIDEENGISLRRHTHKFEHTHETPSGTTTSQSPTDTEVPKKGEIGPIETSVKLTIHNNSSTYLINNIKYDRLDLQESGTSADTYSVPSIPAGQSSEITLKIRESTGTSIENRPYLRIMFGAERTGTNWGAVYGYNTAFGPSSLSSDEGTVSKSTQSSTSTNTYFWIVFIDFSQYISAGGIPSDIEMTLNISHNNTLTTNTGTSVSRSTISYSTNMYCVKFEVS